MSLSPLFETLTGIAAPLLRDHIDTDIIIPSREISSPSREGFGPKLFAPWRYRADGTEDAGFVLNREPWRSARILIAGRNFGCGSSREMAVWALAQFGVGCVIAPSFGSIFRQNCIRNGLLPLELPMPQVQSLAEQAARQALVLKIDLRAQRIERVRSPGSCGGEAHPVDPIPFAFDPEDRDMLLSGRDAIERAWEHRAAIEAFEEQDRRLRPWAWR